MALSYERPKFAIVGGGLAGALLAIDLGRAGFTVDVYEMRGDLRKLDAGGGRSINLALSHRGICGLDRVGLAERVLQQAIPMKGRMIHGTDGSVSFQPYGVHQDQVIHSVSRGGLNCILLDEAERQERVQLHFHHKCNGVDLDSGSIDCTELVSDAGKTISGAIVVGADGAFSAVRRSMLRLDRFDYRQDHLAHGYKELSIPAGKGGSFQMEQNALHIWPRRSFMMIALPNFDGSFTCTIFRPFEGPNSFASVSNVDDLRSMFRREFSDAVPLMPTLEEEFFTNPTSSLATIRCSPWYHEDRIVLIGDAAHAVVPFYGQGMNASFEDVIVLRECMERYAPDWRIVFARYHEDRKRNVDTLADLAVANFIEMRDHTGSRVFLYKKKTEKMLHMLFPKWFVPLYTMVTFTRIPYADAVQRAMRQNQAALAVVTLLLSIIFLIVVFGIV